MVDSSIKEGVDSEELMGIDFYKMFPINKRSKEFYLKIRTRVSLGDGVRRHDDRE